MNKYKTSQLGTTESIITITNVVVHKKIDFNSFIKNYKISNFFKGKYFIKRLIKKIFKYKLKNDFKWDKNFWYNIKILHMKSDLDFSGQFNSKSEAIDFIASTFKKNRLNDINCYKQYLLDNIELDKPLYISSKALEKVGYNTGDDSIFMLDGSRRIIANLLADNSKIDFFLIDSI